MQAQLSLCYLPKVLFYQLSVNLRLQIQRECSGSVVVLDSRPRGRGFKPHRHHCVVSLSKNINPSLVLAQPRTTRPFINERFLMGHKFEPHRRHCVVSLSKNINPSLVLAQPRKTCPFITERLLRGSKESNQTNKNFRSSLVCDNM